MSVRNLVEIDASALRHNIRTICAAVAPRSVIAVVKADAYGLGLERCAPIYAACGAHLLAVAAVSEARRLRRAAPKARVLLLGPVLDHECHDAVALRCECCVSDLDGIRLLEQQAANDSAPCRLHLMIDTGMGRLGCKPSEAPQLVTVILDSPNLHLAGIMTHYPMARSDAVCQDQEKIFADVIAACPPLPNDCLIHKDNSEGSFLRAAQGTNAVRAGLILTGLIPDSLMTQPPALRPAATWRTSIVLVKSLPAGHSISYECQYRLNRDSRIAIIPVGYADGYPVAASGSAQVLIRGQRCNVLGRITMDYLIVDISELPDTVNVGEPVVLFGEQNGDTIHVADIAAWASTIDYEIICGLRGRCGFRIIDPDADQRRATELA